MELNEANYTAILYIQEFLSPVKRRFGRDVLNLGLRDQVWKVSALLKMISNCSTDQKGENRWQEWEQEKVVPS